MHTSLQFASLFTGIAGFDLGLERAGMRCTVQIEINPACRSVLEQHYSVARYEDIRNVTAEEVGPVDLVCGGFPCQDVSVAGLRAGLAGERSGLWFEFHRLIASVRPRWIIVENVPGLLSSNSGQDFAIILRGLVECGYGVAWRILDAQYFGLAQRRKRVFIVGSLGDGGAASVLFEREGGYGDTPPRREAGARVAAGLTKGSAIGRGVNEPGRRTEDDVNLVPAYKLPSTHRGVGNGHNTNFVFGGNNTQGPIERSPALNAHGGSGRLDFESEALIAFAWQQGTSQKGGREWIARAGPYAAGLSASRHDAIAGSMGVRRLTPTECERLQGFPDGWTAGESDSARYRQLGNAVAVPVVEWIARRILKINYSR